MMDAITSFGSQTLGSAWPIVWSLAKITAIVLPILGLVAYLTLWERRLIGWFHIRMGPNRVGPLGLLQPIADAFKLLTKEIITPSQSDKSLFFLAPVVILMPALAAWAVIPFSPGIVLADINAGLLFVMAITSVGVYGVIIAGWASNSKYAFLGAMRAAAQMVSYEIGMGFVLVTVLMVAGTLNLTQIVASQNTGKFASMGLDLPVLELAAAAAAVRDLCSVERCRDESASVRRCRRRIGNRRRSHGRVLGDELRDLLPGRIRKHDFAVGGSDDHVPGWLGGADRPWTIARIRNAAFAQLPIGLVLAFCESVFCRLAVYLVPCFVSPLPL